MLPPTLSKKSELVAKIGGVATPLLCAMHQEEPSTSRNMMLPYVGRDPEIVQITFPKGETGIGLSIVAAQGVGESEPGIYVKKVVPGSAADKDGRLEAGDQLLRVNQQSLVGITQEDAALRMSQAGPMVSFEVAKKAALFNGLATSFFQPSVESPTPAQTLQARDVFSLPRPHERPIYNGHHHHQRFPSQGGHPSPLYHSEHIRSASVSQLEHSSPTMSYQQQLEQRTAPHRQYQNFSPYRQQKYGSPHQQPPHTSLRDQQLSPAPPGLMTKSAEFPKRISPPGAIYHYSNSGLHSRRPRPPSVDEVVHLYRANSTGPQSPSGASVTCSTFVSAAHSDEGVGCTYTDYQNLPMTNQQTLPSSASLSPSNVSKCTRTPPVAGPQPHVVRVEHCEQNSKAQTIMPHSLTNGSSFESHHMAGNQDQEHSLQTADSKSAPTWTKDEQERMEKEIDDEVIRLMQEQADLLEQKEFLTEQEERRPPAKEVDSGMRQNVRNDYIARDEDQYREDVMRERFQFQTELSCLQQDQLNNAATETEKEREMRRLAEAAKTEMHCLETHMSSMCVGESRVPLVEDFNYETSAVPRKLRPQVPPKRRMGPEVTDERCLTALALGSIHHANGTMEEFEQNKRYVYLQSESEVPRTQILGAQEVYRDPRQERLHKIQQQQAQKIHTIDGSNLDFKSKMKMFAKQLGENTPNERVKASRAQRDIEEHVTSPPVNLRH